MPRCWKQPAREVGASACAPTSVLQVLGNVRGEGRDRSQDAASVRRALSLRGTAAAEHGPVRGVRESQSKAECSCSESKSILRVGEADNGRGGDGWWWFGAGAYAAALLSFSFP